jgi:hypothetical protein
MGGSDDNREKHLSGYPTIRRTSDLPGKKQGCETFIFLSCSTLTQKSYRSFLLARSLPLRLLKKILQSRSNITSDQTCRSPRTGTLSKTDGPEFRSVCNSEHHTAHQAALSSSQQYASTLNINYQHAEVCLIQQAEQYAAIANASRK